MDATSSFEVVTNLFKLMAKDAAYGEGNNNEGAMLDNIKLAKHHLVFKWTLLVFKVDVPIVVASLNVGQS